MLGAIAGDIIGSPYEYRNIKSEDFPLFHSKLSRFTDDTVLTCATADAILTHTPYADKYLEYYRLYPVCGFGSNFKTWGIRGDKKPYNSFGNGSAMRVGPVAYAYDTLEDVLAEAKRSAKVTHNHPEGVKGAQSTAIAIFLARKGYNKPDIKKYIEDNYAYNLDFDLEQLKREYTYDISCQGSVPQAIFCFLVSKNYEDAIRKAISIGGDSDTIACITGSIAEAFYKNIPDHIKGEVIKRLDNRLSDIVRVFMEKIFTCRERI